MATKMLESSAVSAFCESVAVMHSAGIQMDEAVFLLGENMEDAAFKRACDDVYKELIVGKPLALAMDDSGCFPSHVVDMVGAGEHAGRLENVLWSLARYYDEEDRLYAKIKNAIAYRLRCCASCRRSCCSPSSSFCPCSWMCTMASPAT